MRVCPHESVNCTQKTCTGPLSRRGMVIAPRYDKKKIKKLYWPFVQTRDGHHLAKKIKKYN